MDAATTARHAAGRMIGTAADVLLMHFSMSCRYDGLSAKAQTLPTVPPRNPDRNARNTGGEKKPLRSEAVFMSGREAPAGKNVGLIASRLRLEYAKWSSS